MSSDIHGHPWFSGLTTHVAISISEVSWLCDFQNSWMLKFAGFGECGIRSMPNVREVSDSVIC